MTFMRQNLEEIPKVVELAIEHGVDRVKVSLGPMHAAGIFIEH